MRMFRVVGKKSKRKTRKRKAQRTNCGKLNKKQCFMKFSLYNYDGQGSGKLLWGWLGKSAHGAAGCMGGRRKFKSSSAQYFFILSDKHKMERKIGKTKIQPLIERKTWKNMVESSFSRKVSIKSEWDGGHWWELRRGGELSTHYSAVCSCSAQEMIVSISQHLVIIFNPFEVSKSLMEATEESSLPRQESGKEATADRKDIWKATSSQPN